MFKFIKAAAKAVLKLVDATPISAIIKAGIFVGVAAFTAYIMIKRVLEMRKKSTDEKQYSPVDEILGKSYVTDSSVFDELDAETKKLCKKLNKGGKRKKKKVVRKEETEKQRPVQTVSLFDDDDDDYDPATATLAEQFLHGWKGGRTANDLLIEEAQRKNARKANTSRSKKKKVNYDKERRSATRQSVSDLGFFAKEYADVSKEKLLKVAKELGLPVDDIDEDIPDEVRKAAPNLF